MFKLLGLLFITNIYLAKAIYPEWEAKNPAFDSSVYEDALNSELCAKQLEQIRKNPLLAMEFIESGLRIPRGILMGNLVDLGNYHECIQIDKYTNGVDVQGKYCLLNVPANQLDLKTNTGLGLLDTPDGKIRRERFSDIREWTDFDPRRLKVSEDLAVEIRDAMNVENAVKTFVGAGDPNKRSALLNVHFQLAVCVPKACTVEEGLNGILANVSATGLKYEELFCRVKNDKLWVPADYVSLVIFTMIGFISLLSTSYDLYHTYKLKSDPKQISTIYRSFSLYTNCRRLTSFTTSHGALECVDGIRAIAMMWVIVAHTFTTFPPRINFLESVNWTLSFDSQWISAGTLSVDTFFMISGMLMVYTTAGKMNGTKLMKNLHVFYLHRLLRMFPLLAAAILIQASFLYRMADGPVWDQPARNTDSCRKFWWSTFLYIQNIYNPNDMCLPHSWYLAIDIQMHIVSPIVLFWVLSGSKTKAWVALSASFLTVLSAATAFNFIMEFPGDILHPARAEEGMDYMYYVYVNSLTRAAPFFLGMGFGYILYLFRGKKVQLSPITALLLWIGAFSLTSLAAMSGYPMKDMQHDNQTLDSLVNSYARTLWCTGLCWIIFACVHGYGGPINWLLSLQMWKLPSRLSYGMYLFHYPIMFVTAGTAISPVYFTPMGAVYRFLSELLIAFMASFALTLVIDSPFSTLFKLMFGGGPKRPQTQEKNGALPNEMKRSEGFDKDKIDVKL